jgi:hypothetical protein
MKQIQNRLFAAALIVAESDVRACAVRAATHLLRRGERGDADSAGSTLRTIMVVIVVTAVVGAIGAAVRTAGGRAADCIVNAGC